jgi:hypothetical protein
MMHHWQSVRQFRKQAATRSKCIKESALCLSSPHLAPICRLRALHPCPPQRIPERIVEKAVKGMLPKGPIGSILFTHLKVGNSVIYTQACTHTDPFPNTLAHTFRLLHC